MTCVGVTDTTQCQLYLTDTQRHDPARLGVSYSGLVTMLPERTLTPP